MQIYIHQTHHTIADFEQIFAYLENLSKADYFHGNIHIFPELFLTGYPLGDLLLERGFINKYHDMFEGIRTWWDELKVESNTAILLGGLDYGFENDRAVSIENVVFELSNRANLEKIYTKCLLPNYDIFDEMKYFNAGKDARIWEFAGLSFGFLICEDMWHSPHYPIDPLDMLLEISQGRELNGIINFSGSPFHINKEDSRIARANEISDIFNLPFYYVNRVGSEDEIVFDGGSFLVKDNAIIKKAKNFEQEVLSCEIYPKSPVTKLKEIPKTSHSWESLYSPRLEKLDKTPRLSPITEHECEKILHALKLGIQDYAHKAGMNKFLVALSGGMDSALVLTLVKMFLKPDQEVEAIYMPSQFSAPLSWEISSKLCQTLDIKLTSMPIKFLHSAVKNQFEQSFEPMVGLADENIQSRLRGALLFARSNQTGAMVLNTSNKSEIAVGYSTLYGDSVGAISPLGDLYKSEVYALARYINKKFNNIIPVSVIERPASAELREDQEDQHSLPAYEVLDTILECYLSYLYSDEDIIDMGFNEEEVRKVVRLCNIAEYKRKQFCPIIKLKSKSFGFGRRIPISKRF